jgi:hypothetical protein
MSSLDDKNRSATPRTDAVLADSDGFLETARRLQALCRELEQELSGANALGMIRIRELEEAARSAIEPAKLEKHAQVGGTVFHPGVKWSIIIGRAEREYAYQQEASAALASRSSISAAESGWLIEFYAGPTLWYSGEVERFENGRRAATFIADASKAVRYPTKAAAELAFAELTERRPRALLGRDCYRVTEHLWQSPSATATPDDWVLVPRNLTAEDGFKFELSGEISFKCCGDMEAIVPWTTIKDLHRKVVARAEKLRADTRNGEVR